MSKRELFHTAKARWYRAYGADAAFNREWLALHKAALAYLKATQPLTRVFPYVAREDR